MFSVGKRILSLLLTVIVAVPMMLLGPGISAQEVWEKRTIRYQDIEEIVDGSLDFSGQRESLKEMQSLFNQTKTSLDNLAEDLTRQLATLPETSELRGVIQGLLVNTQALSGQVAASATTIGESISQVNSARDQLVVGVKNLFITYNTLYDQRQELSRSLTVIDANLAAAEKQYELGMSTALDLENTRQNRVSVLSGMETMDFQLRNLKRSLNAMIGRNYDDGISIGDIPSPDLSYVEEINFRDDLEDAGGYYGVSSIPSNHEDFEEIKGSFGASLRKQYENIGENQRLLQEAEDALALETKNFEASQLQYDLGMISKLALTNAQDTLDTKKASVKAARDNLFLAIEQYKWAVEYGIISS